MCASGAGPNRASGMPSFKRWSIWVSPTIGTHDRQHQRSRPRLGSGRKREACTNALGRSRGGITSKIHARCDNQALPIGFVLTGGEASDYTAGEPLMALPWRHCWQTKVMTVIVSGKAC